MGVRLHVHTVYCCRYFNSVVSTCLQPSGDRYYSLL